LQGLFVLFDKTLYSDIMWLMTNQELYFLNLNRETPQALGLSLLLFAWGISLFKGVYK